MNVSGKSISQQLRDMKLDERIDFPPAAMRSIRALASGIGFECDRKFTTHINHEKRVIEVTRIK